MKNIFFACLFLLSSLKLFAQLQDAESFMSGSYDKALIQSQKIKTLEILMLIDGKKSMVYTFNFDKQGRLERQLILDSLRNPVKEYYFEYNLDGDYIKKIEFDIALNQKQTYNFQNVYEGSRLISRKCVELLAFEKHSYSSEGKRILTEMFIGTDTLNASTMTSSYSYDDLGRLAIKSEMSSYKGEVSYRETFNYFYNEQNKIWIVSRSDDSKVLLKYQADNLLKTVEKRLHKDLGGLSLVDVYSYQFWE